MKKNLSLFLVVGLVCAALGFWARGNSGLSARVAELERKVDQHSEAIDTTLDILSKHSTALYGEAPRRNN